MWEPGQKIKPRCFRAALALSSMIALTLLVPAARACWLPQPTLIVDPAEARVDSVAPTAPVVGLDSIRRGRPAPEKYKSLTTWDGIFGSIAFDVVPPEDDRTKELEFGYLPELVSGELPSGLRLPDAPLLCAWRKWPLLAGDPEDFVVPVILLWGDGDEGPKESFRFEIRFAAVDRAGNQSEYSEPVLVVYDGAAP